SHARMSAVTVQVTRPRVFPTSAVAEAASKSPPGLDQGSLGWCACDQVASPSVAGTPLVVLQADGSPDVASPQSWDRGWRVTATVVGPPSPAFVSASPSVADMICAPAGTDDRSKRIKM